MRPDLYRKERSTWRFNVCRRQSRPGFSAGCIHLFLRIFFCVNFQSVYMNESMTVYFRNRLFSVGVGLRYRFGPNRIVLHWLKVCLCGSIGFGSRGGKFSSAVRISVSISGKKLVFPPPCHPGTDYFLKVNQPAAFTFGIVRREWFAFLEKIFVPGCVFAKPPQLGEIFPSEITRPTRFYRLSLYRLLLNRDKSRTQPDIPDRFNEYVRAANMNVRKTGSQKKKAVWFTEKRNLPPKSIPPQYLPINNNNYFFCRVNLIANIIFSLFPEISEEGLKTRFLLSSISSRERKMMKFNGR